MPRPLRVLGLTRYARRGASSRVRLLQFIDALQREGVRVDARPLLGESYLARMYAGEKRATGDVARAYLRRLLDARTASDVVWVEKELLPFVPAVLERALLRRPYVVDIDDAWYLNYAEHSSRLVRGTLGRKIARLMRHAAAVVAGNDHLARYARRAGARRVEVLPSVVPVRQYSTAENRDGFALGWIGAPATVRYLETLRPVFNALGAARPLRVVVMGARFDPGPGFRVEHVEWSERAERAVGARFDVGLMPLDRTPWAEGKCAYKLVQYMASARATVASAVGANQQVVVPGETGFLCEDEADWLPALSQLAESATLRSKMGRAGRVQALAHYDVDGCAPRLARVLREAAA